MEQIIKKNALELYKDNMITYTIETNLRRAFPDWRDGLKIVQRRILYAMWNNLPAATKLIKTSRVVGETMGVYHPHGDTSIGDAAKIMSNWFDTYVPTLIGHGNFGTYQGDGAAAMRYTENMLAPFSLDAIFEELGASKSIVDWAQTYDYTSVEPEFLPVKVPLLLINGSYGIGTGEIVSIPPHNMSDVINATIRLMDDPNTDVVIRPDQKMPCEIVDTNWKAICNSGNGKFKVRSIIDIEIMDKGTKKEHPALVVKSTPDFVSWDKGSKENGGIKYKIIELVEQGKLPQIKSIDEDSHGNDMRAVIHLNKGSDPEYVRQYLYKTTSLQVTQIVNFKPLNGLELTRFSYKSYLTAFIELRKLTKFRYVNLLLQDARTVYHEMDAFIKIIESNKLDEVIRRIRTNKKEDEQANLEWLCKNFSITDLQAKFILETKLKNLSPYKVGKYKEKAAKCQETEKWCLDRIYHASVIMDDIKAEMIDIRDKYAFKTKSRYISEDQVSNIPQGEFKVVITEANYIKKLPLNEYIGTYRGDNPVHIVKVDNTKDILLFTAQGKVFKVPVHTIPISEKGASGTDLRILVKGLVSDVIGLVYLPNLEKLAKLVNKHYLVVCTKYNKIKKLDLDDVINAPPSGIVFSKLMPGDIVNSITIASDNLDVIIYSDKKALRCSMTDIQNYKRNTSGVAAMSSSETIDGVSVIYPDSTDIVVVTESGKINRFDIAGLERSNRNKAGSRVIDLKKGDVINSIFGVNENLMLHIITRTTKIDIPVSDIPKASSASKGTPMISTKGDNIVKVTVINK